MKVVLIAGFLDNEIRKQNVFKKDSPLFQKLVRLFRLPSRVGQLNDHAPWVRGLISFLETQDGLELHVIGPQIRLKKCLVEFELRGVKYHFYSSEWASFLRKLNNYSLWKKLQPIGHKARRIIDKVNPDIVVLSGAENPVTSIAILYADKYPRYCLCQTVYNNPERSLYSTPNKLIQEMEKAIFSNLRCFGVYSKMHYDLLKAMRPEAYVFKFGFPSRGKLRELVETEKQYDFVNFALMHGSRKGTPDSIQALAIVKKTFPNVSLNIVGGCSEEDLIQLKELVKSLDLEENVIFTPFFEKRSDLFQHVKKSRFAVLPCKLDHISGTMNQSMRMGLPLVVYETTGTPSFNKEKECVLIAEKGNVEELAQHMLTLMKNPEKAETLRRNAFEMQKERLEYTMHNGERLLANFRAIIDYYRSGTPIPDDQLFNPEIDD